jgi:DNA-binding response OmpR family regulator
MINFNNALIYLAIHNTAIRSQMENFLVLENCNVTAFASAQDLWIHHRIRPARLVITDRRFGSQFSGIELTDQLRRHLSVPYVYVVMLSSLGTVAEIQEALASGVDDYLLKPHSLPQIRSRILVGLRWIAHLDAMHLVEDSRDSGVKRLAAC